MRARGWCFLLALAVCCGAGESMAEAPEAGFVDVDLHAEVGFLGAFSHTVQFGQDGTEFDYVEEGGQDVLFFFWRLSADVTLGETQNHILTFLYQPLQLEGRTVLTRDHRIDEVLFPAGMAVDSVYSFPFWRLSYGYDILDDPDNEVSFGLGLQIRDATIDFTSADGGLRASNRGVGPVPLLEFRGRMDLGHGMWWGAEVDGFYAPVSVLNGSDNEITGAILDANLRFGLSLKSETQVFLNARYLGGGAVGTDDDAETGDGFTRNWLHFGTLSLGFTADVL